MVSCKAALRDMANLDRLLNDAIASVDVKRMTHLNQEMIELTMKRFEAIQESYGDWITPDLKNDVEWIFRYLEKYNTSYAYKKLDLLEAKLLHVAMNMSIECE